MQVFVVLGCFNYEGADYDSAQVFTNFEAAAKYANAIVSPNSEYRYDSYRIVEREVQQ